MLFRIRYSRFGNVVEQYAQLSTPQQASSSTIMRHTQILLAKKFGDVNPTTSKTFLLAVKGMNHLASSVKESDLMNSLPDFNVIQAPVKKPVSRPKATKATKKPRATRKSSQTTPSKSCKRPSASSRKAPRSTSKSAAPKRAGAPSGRRSPSRGTATSSPPAKRSVRGKSSSRSRTSSPKLRKSRPGSSTRKSPPRPRTPSKR